MKPDKAAVKRLLTGPDGDRITYYQIAKGTGRHVTTVCKIFVGSRRPSLETASRISSFLGCTIEELKSALHV